MTDEATPAGGPAAGSAGRTVLPGAHARPRKRRRWPRVVAAVASVGVLVAASAGAALSQVFTQLEDNITALDISDQVGSDRPVRPVIDEAGNYSPLNILLMGSDSRQGKDNRGYGSASLIGGERSDTTILLHVSADRQHATAVSFPRDTWVTLPTCKDRETGTTVGGYENKFNVAFDLGGPGCTLKLVEQLTGLRVDNFVVVDFGGFKRVIQAMDGVEVCLTEPVNDPLSGLDLPKGKSVVSGEQALAFVRARKTLGDGSDLSRIQRQQAFLSSLIRKASSSELLLNPVSLYNVLDAATESLTADKELAKLDNLRDLALSMREMKPGQITFLTMPWVPRGDNANVLLNADAAAPIWQAMRDDTPWPPKKDTDQPRLTTPPERITVRVLDGSSVAGMAQKAIDDLEARGYTVIPGGKADRRDYAESLVRYDPGWDESGKTLAWAVTGATSESEAGLGGTLELVVGDNYSEVRKVKISSSSGTDATTAVTTADEVVCAS